MSAIPPGLFDSLVKTLPALGTGCKTVVAGPNRASCEIYFPFFGLFTMTSPDIASTATSNICPALSTVKE